MIRRTVVVVVVIGLSIVWASAQQPQPTRPAQGQTQTQTNQTGQAPNQSNEPVTIFNVTESPRQPPAAQPDKTGWQKLLDSALDPIAWLTFALLVMAVLDFVHYRGELSDTRLIERAYVDIAHKGPLEFHEPQGIWFTLGVKNCGRTPADVLGGVIGFAFAEPGQPAPVAGSRQTTITPAFLVPDKRMEFRTMVFNIPQEHIDRAITGDDVSDPIPMQMWLLGYVDYRDKFGCEHRTGYGRRFNRHAAVVNNEGETVRGGLVFDETTASMNYDRPLLPSDDRPYERHPQRREQQG